MGPVAAPSPMSVELRCSQFGPGVLDHLVQSAAELSEQVRTHGMSRHTAYAPWPNNGASLDRLRTAVRQ